VFDFEIQLDDASKQRRGGRGCCGKNADGFVEAASGRIVD
jgi:hypothetical protein